jgi:hypothetical protein
MKPSFSKIVLIALVFCIAGCSREIVPIVGSENEVRDPAPDGHGDLNRLVLGIWKISFDTVKLTAAIEELREIQTHYNITNMLVPPACDDCLKIVVNSFNPTTRILDVDVTLRNPTLITGYDVRGIVYTDEAGHELRNADDWTRLFDIPVGDTINPFKAFAKSENLRAFKPAAQHTENYLIYIPDPPQYESITFCADASFPDNCREPYMITDFEQETIFNYSGAKGFIYIKVYDWQDDVSKVTLVAPELTGEQFIQFSHFSGNVWRLELTIDNFILPGDYKARVIAASANSVNIALYDLLTIIISQGDTPPDLVYATPLSLESEVTDVSVDGGYAWAATSAGLTVYDVHTPEKPVLYKNYKTLPCIRVKASGNYACILSEHNFVVADISDPGSLTILKSLDIPVVQAKDMAISDGYAYLSVYSFGAGKPWLYIIQLNPPGDAHLTATVSTPGEDIVPKGLAVDAGYVYVIDEDGALLIADVAQPDSPYYVNKVDLPGSNDVAVMGDYAYVTTSSHRLEVIDINPPDSASIVGGVLGVAKGLYITIHDTLAYISDGYKGISVFDLNQPTAPVFLKSLFQTSEDAEQFRVSFAGDYAYIPYGRGGLFIAEMYPLDNAHVVSAIGGSPATARDMVVADGYAYVADGYYGLRIVDIDPLESASVVSTVYIPGYYIEGVAVSDGYAYLATYHDLFVIDVSPPEEAHITQTILYDTSYSTYSDISISGNCGVLLGHYYIAIININPPASTTIVKYIDSVPDDGVQHTGALETNGDFAYIVYDGPPGPYLDWGHLSIWDINPPELTHKVSSILFPEPHYVPKYPDYKQGIEISNNYAYIADCNWYFIVDVSSVTEPVVIKEIQSFGVACDIAVYDGYAFLGEGNFGIKVLDIDPPEQTHYMGVYELLTIAVRLEISENYLYYIDHLYENADHPERGLLNVAKII